MRVLVLVLVWWITEAIPLPVTALLGPALAVILGVGTATEMFAPFGDPIVILFLGGFLLAEAMVTTGLDRRVAYAILGRRWVGASPTRILVAFTVPRLRDSPSSHSGQSSGTSVPFLKCTKLFLVAFF